MFEEMYKEHGKVRIPTGEYINGMPQYSEHVVKLLTFEKGERDTQPGTRICENTFLIKSDTLQTIPVDARLVTAAGKIYDIGTVVKIKNFTGKIECFRILVL